MPIFLLTAFSRRTIAVEEETTCQPTAYALPRLGRYGNQAIRWKQGGALVMHEWRCTAVVLKLRGINDPCLVETISEYEGRLEDDAVRLADLRDAHVGLLLSSAIDFPMRTIPELLHVSFVCHSRRDSP